MYAASVSEAIELAEKYLDNEQIRNPCEESTKADELRRFWMWNPPSFSEGKPYYWGGWEVFRGIDPEAGDDDIHKMSVDMARYFVERSEMDWDYWDALKKILSTTLSSSDPLIRSNALASMFPWLAGRLSGWPSSRSCQAAWKQGSQISCPRWMHLFCNSRALRNGRHEPICGY